MPVKRQLVRALEDADVVRIKEIIDDKDNEKDIGDECMEIVTAVCDYLSKETQEALPHLVTCVMDTLAKVATLGNPKELLMSLLEQLDGFKDSSSVTRLLPSLGTVLTRVKRDNMSVSWNWALNTVSCHLKTCPTPPNMGLESAERITLDQTEEACECLELCEACIEMTETLVAVIVDNEEDRDNRHRRTVLLNFVMSILGPLSSLSQAVETDKNGIKMHPASRPAAQKLMNIVAKITNNIWTNILEFPESHDRKVICETEPLDSFSLPTFVYLLLAEEMSTDRMPSIYTPHHLLRTAASFIITLIDQKNEIRIHKGLLLLSKLLYKVAAESLDNEASEDPQLISLLKPLVNVIVYQNVEELRRLGFSCYSSYIKMFSLEARYNVYNYALNTANHSGLIGWTVTHLKDTISKCLPMDNFPSTYSGSKFSHLVSPLLKLQHGPETDLLEISEELLAILNFVQFFIVRDRENKTGIAEMRPAVKEWLEDLTKGLDLSIAHYQQKAADPFDGHIDPEASSVTVGGRQLPPMDPDQMKHVIQSALNTFSLIQFNLGRVRDLL